MSGEGAKEDDFDDISPSKRIERSVGRVDELLERAATAESSTAAELRAEAASVLSSVRADMFKEDGDLERYLALQERIADEP